MKQKVIQLQNVWKIYEMGDVKVEALRGLDLEVYKGEFLAVEGPSGSGKSTAMNMIGALDYPTRGKVILDKHDIHKLSESSLAQIRGKKIGFVFQQFNLISILTAQENVELPMLFQDIQADARKERAQKLLQLVDLGDRMDHRPAELSGGQQQRVAIARALANDPEVILADEPTGNLDSKTGTAVMNLLVTLKEDEKKTIVMITHDAQRAKAADRIAYLKDGQVVKTEKR